jgi:hypothetical protein
LFGGHVKKDPGGLFRNKVSDLIISRLFTVKSIQTRKRGRKMNNRHGINVLSPNKLTRKGGEREEK